MKLLGELNGTFSRNLTTEVRVYDELMEAVSQCDIKSK